MQKTVVPFAHHLLFGIIADKEAARVEFGTPVLSKIPYLKRGFTNVGYGQSMTRSSISVSVRIIDLRAEEERFLKGK